ncbi:amidase [Aldersonia kunmingensis]|uniref:amidase n=1 Tax=Aldersonia kunmingensis TaxID=408066 RepID=UPI000A67B11D|nr:amidase [Aldersonia kunmingensis]
MSEHLPSDLVDWTASDLVAAYRRRDVSPVETTESVFERIGKVDPVLNAFVRTDAEAALAQARESERRWRAGRPVSPLDGVPVSIKDLLLASGWPTLRGSKTVDPDQDWDVDSPPVARLREAGAVLIGKTTTPEFGWKAVTESPLSGITRNPWNPAHTPGGSSGGAAAAVASGMGPLAVGTDGGGSIRIPAGFCGLVGFKPTFGTVPIYPPGAFGTLFHAGPLARTVRDAALLLDVISGFDSRDWSALATPTRPFRFALDTPLTGLRIAFSADFGYAAVDAEVAALVAAAVEVLAGLGAEVVAEDPGFDNPLEAFHCLWLAGAAKATDHLDDEQRGELDPEFAEACDRGREISAADYLEATARRMDLGVWMGAFHERYDLLVTPTVPLPAFEAGQNTPPDAPARRSTGWTPFSFPFNLTQQPAITVPCGFTTAGLPVGLQIVGPRHADVRVLNAAKAHEDATSWWRSRPAV